MMHELRPHGRELLEAARRERTPSPADRERLLSELLVAAEPGPASSASARSPLSRGARVLLFLVFVLGIGLTLCGVGSIGRP